MIAILAIFLGIIPTVKSELEAGILESATRIQSASPERQVNFVKQIWEGLKNPVDRFEEDERDADIPTRIARGLLRGLNTLLGASMVYIVVAALSFAIVYLSARLNNRVRKDVYHDLRGYGLRRAISIEAASVIPDRSNPAGHLSSAIQRGAETIGNTYAFVLEAGQYVFAFFVALYAIATKSWQLSLVCLIVVAIQALISVYQARRLKSDREEFDDKRNRLLSSTDEILSKREILLAYEQDVPYAQRLDEETQRFAQLERKLDNKENLFAGLVSLTEDYGRLLVLVGALLIVFLVEDVSFRDSGDVYFLIAIYIRLLVPATNLLRRYDVVRKSGATASTYLHVAQAEADFQLDDGPQTSTWSRSQDIAFEDVHFAYHADYRPVLEGITFFVPAGKTTLIVGPSGCGKTTIARLILGYCRKSRGSVHIGGSEIDCFSGKVLREQMSYVAQGDHITDESVRDNLAWARHQEEISDDEMHAALQQVGLGNFSNGEDPSHVSCSKLSGGQQQRVSIARMMLDDAEIVIMDEPLAGVDIFTLRDLMPQLRYLLRGKEQTVILISHRLLYSSMVDHIVVMNEQGRVVEEGNTDELKKSDGIFASLLEAARIET